MNKAWFFGDSFTYGSGCTPKSEYYRKFPEKRGELWTSLVAKKLGYQEVNKGIPAASIPIILNELITHIPLINPGDAVYLSDTAITRFYIPNKHTKKIGSTVYGYLDGELPTKEKQTTIDYIENCIAPYLDLWRLLYFNQYDSLRLILIDKQVDVYFWSHLVWSIENIHEDDQKIHTIAKDTNGAIRDGHFSWKGHREMAELVLKLPKNTPIKIKAI